MARVSNGTTGFSSSGAQRAGDSFFPPPFRGGGEKGKSPPGPAADLTEAERERIAANVAEVRQSLPELVPLIRDLHAEGLIDGWRAIDYAGPHRQTERGLTLDQIVIGLMFPQAIGKGRK